MKLGLVLLVVGVAAVALPTSGLADTIDFESDALGGRADPFTSNDSSLVHFSDTIGDGLFIFSGTETDGRSLGVNSDGDGSKLQMDFDVLVSALALDFGNDDPFWTNANDRAWLSVYSGAALVGTVSMAMNRNDLMDQTISFSGAGSFDRAFFWYGDAAGDVYTQGQNTGLIEVVDNITFAPVPEPASIVLLGLGLAGLGASRRRRRAS